MRTRVLSRTYKIYIILYYIILYYIISYHIISYHIISYHIISYHIISYYIILYYIILYYIILYYIYIYTCTYLRLDGCGPGPLSSQLSRPFTSGDSMPSQQEEQRCSPVMGLHRGLRLTQTKPPAVPGHSRVLDKSI